MNVAHVQWFTSIMSIDIQVWVYFPQFPHHFSSGYFHPLQWYLYLCCNDSGESGEDDVDNDIDDDLNTMFEYSWTNIVHKTHSTNGNIALPSSTSKTVVYQTNYASVICRRQYLLRLWQIGGTWWHNATARKCIKSDFARSKIKFSYWWPALKPNNIAYVWLVNSFFRSSILFLMRTSRKTSRSLLSLHRILLNSTSWTVRETS